VFSGKFNSSFGKYFRLNGNIKSSRLVPEVLLQEQMFKMKVTERKKT
jgi:hypothetical protein